MVHASATPFLVEQPVPGGAGATLKCNELTDAVLYTTLQPCRRCTMASIWVKIGRIVYGAGRDDVNEMYFENRHLDTVDFIRDAYKDDLSLEGGLMAEECAALYVAPGADIPKTSSLTGEGKLCRSIGGEGRLTRKHDHDTPSGHMRILAVSSCVVARWLLERKNRTCRKLQRNFIEAPTETDGHSF
jgi:hypothetical protein